MGLGCAGDSPRSIETLVVHDSVYVDPASGLPYSGPVYRRFADQPTMNQVEGTLREGLWHGAFRVYHPNGRVRYMGAFHGGARCGPWTENADSTAVADAYALLVNEIESLGVYPHCPES